MSKKYVKSLIVVMLLAAFAGCATGGATNTSAFPASASGEAVG
jgi:predicted small lipoprotein YifL